jgi:hypothetical protein
VEKRITVTLDDRLHDFIRESASEDDRTPSATIRRLIRQAAQNAARHEPREHAT